MKAGVDKTIHLFALLHVATVLVCRYTGVSDEIWLTLLTIMMVVLLGIRLGAKVELTAAGVIVTNVLGFLLGTSGARLLSLVSGSELLIHSLATFATTEIIGWGIFGFLTVFSRNSRQQTSDNTGKHAPPRQNHQETAHTMAGMRTRHRTAVPHDADTSLLQQLDL